VPLTSLAQVNADQEADPAHPSIDGDPVLRDQLRATLSETRPRTPALADPSALLVLYQLHDGNGDLLLAVADRTRVTVALRRR